MVDNPNRAKPQLWFGPSPNVATSHLICGIAQGKIRATFRMGVRDASHEKGYAEGEHVLLQVVQNNRVMTDPRWGVITKLTPRRLGQFSDEEVALTNFYRTWEEVAQDLSFFDGHTVSGDTEVTLVEFDYSSARDQVDPDGARWAYANSRLPIFVAC